MRGRDDGLDWFLLVTDPYAAATEAAKQEAETRVRLKVLVRRLRLLSWSLVALAALNAAIAVVSLIHLLS